MPQIEQGWEILKRNTDVMKDLVLDMLSYSKPLQLNYQPTDVNRICADVAALLGEKAKEDHIKIRLDLDSCIEPPELDSKAMYRCILNLVSNAVEACADK